MTKHRDWTIQVSNDPCFIGFDAIHDNYDAEHDCDGHWIESHPVFYGNTVQDCIEQIDDWYEDNEDD